MDAEHKPRSLGRRRADRKWPRLLRDFWMLAVTALVLLALSNVRDTTRQVARNQQNNTRTLCSFRDDLQTRVTSGNAFLKTHPKGIAGIPAATIRVSIQNEQRTLNALRPLVCPKH